MHIRTCKHCGKTFEAKSKRGNYCPTRRCYSAMESRRGQERYQAYSSERRKAALAVARSLLNGDLVRQPCETCGEWPVVAHHDDYAAPLDVRWLCISHHRLHHIKHGPGKNAFAT
jgi:ribosomal protein S27AE